MAKSIRSSLYLRNDPVNLVDPDGQLVFGFDGGFISAITGFFQGLSETVTVSAYSNTRVVSFMTPALPRFLLADEKYELDEWFMDAGTDFVVQAKVRQIQQV